MSARNKIEFLQLPSEFPVARDVRDIGNAARNQLNWYYDLRRALQGAIEDLKNGRFKFDSAARGGTVAASLGNGPVVAGGAPYAWVEVTAPDGTACVMPIWKKG